MPDNPIVAQVLETWDCHNQINLLLLKAISSAGLTARPAGSRGRSVDEQFIHVIQVRRGWLHYQRTGQRPRRSAIARPKDSSRAALRQHLVASGREVATLLADHLIAGKPIRAFGRYPVRWLGYLISHESHHRGSTLLALKQEGIRLPPSVTLDGLWGRWMWG